MAAQRKHQKTGGKPQYPSLSNTKQYLPDTVTLYQLKQMESREQEQIQKCLEGMEKSEDEIFKTDPLYTNCLTHIYLNNSKKNVSDLVKQVLSKDPSNLIALDNKYRNHKALKENDAKQKCKKVISNAMKEELNRTCAEAEIAYYFSKLDPRLYPKSIELLERAIEKSKTTVDNIKLKVWGSILLSIYNRVFNREFHQYVPNFKPDLLFKRIKDIILDKEYGIRNSQSVFGPRSYADLADTYSKYVLIGRREHRVEKLPFNWDTETCFKRALQESSHKDAHVLEKYGRYLRKIACSKQELIEAIAMLEASLDICPTRHVAAHHLALAYKALWWEEQNLPQRHLFGNKVRRGLVKKGDNVTSFSQKSSRKKKGKVQVIPPRHPRDIKDTPKHYDGQDYYDNLRAENPISKVCSPSLQNAKHYLVQANENACGTRAVYLIDLARVCWSLQEFDDAEMYFSKADKKEIFKSPKDFALLYEQWAMLKQFHIKQECERHSIADGWMPMADAAEAPEPESELTDSYVESSSYEFSEHSDINNVNNQISKALTDIEALYLKSIKMSLKVNSKSRVSYYKLRDALKLKAKQDVGILPVLADIYLRVGNTEEAGAIITTLQSKDKSQFGEGANEYITRLSIQYFKAKGQHIEAVDFIIGKEDCNYSGVELLDLCSKAGPESLQSNPSMMTEIFQYVMANEKGLKRRHSSSGPDSPPIDQSESNTCNSDLESDEKIDFLVVSYDNKPWIENLLKYLRNMSGGAVKLATENGFDDIPTNKVIGAILDEWIPKTNIMIICIDENIDNSCAQLFYNNAVISGNSKCRRGVLVAQDPEHRFLPTSCASLPKIDTSMLSEDCIDGNEEILSRYRMIFSQLDVLNSSKSQ